VLGGGSILGGLFLGAIGVFIIERDSSRPPASRRRRVDDVLRFMHGERIGLGQSPAVAASYLVVAVIFVACAKSVTVSAAQPVIPTAELHAEELAV